MEAVLDQGLIAVTGGGAGLVDRALTFFALTFATEVIVVGYLARAAALAPGQRYRVGHGEGSRMNSCRTARRADGTG